MDVLSRRFDHRTGVLTSIDERLREEDGDRGFALKLRSTYHGELHIREFSSQERHHATDHLRVDFALQTHQFDIIEVLCTRNQFVAVPLYLLRHKGLNLLLETGVLFDGFMDGSGKIRCVIEEPAQTVQHVLRRVVEFIGLGSCHCLYTAHAGSHRSLHDDAYRTDLSGRRHVATAAELNRRTVLDDTHVIAVFLAKERHGSHGFRLSYRRMTAFFEFQVLTNEFIRYLLHLAQLLGCHFLEVAEVKTQAVGGHERAFLLYVLAQHLTQRIMEDMRRSMVAHDRSAALSIHLSGEFAGDTCHTTCDERHLVHDQYRQTVLALAVEHLKALVIQTQATGIADLTTHLRVKGVLGDDDLEERLAFLLHAAVTKDLGLYSELVVAHEIRLAFLDDIPVAEVLLIRRATHLFLVRKGFVILLLVGGETVLAKDEFREVKRETVGVLEREDIDTADLSLTGFLRFVHQLIEETDTFIERAEECLLLGFDDRHDLRLLLHQLGVRFAQIGDELRYQLIEERLTHVEERITVPHGTAKDTTDDVTGFLVRRQLTVGDSKRYRTDMVCDDAHGYIGLLVLAVLAMTDLADLLQHRLEDIGVVVGGLTLDGTHETLEAHTGVDHFLRQRLQRSVRFAVILHEDDVPDLDDLRVILVH